MELDQQIQALIDQAPQDGATPQAVAAIAPAIRFLAEQLKHSQYYIMQSLDGSWVFTTLQNRDQPHLTKTVIYAYPSLKDAAPRGKQDWQAIATAIPVTHLLFQLLSLATVDSIVFFETSGNLASGTEVKRTELQTLIETHLQHLQSALKSPSRPIPPNIA